MENKFRPGSPLRGWGNLPNDISEPCPATTGQLPLPEPLHQEPLGEIALEAFVNGLEPVQRELVNLLQSRAPWVANSASASADKYD